MSKVLSPPDNCRTTDHSEEIARLRDIASDLRGLVARGAKATADLELRVAAVETTAALLEVHDDTGISLDDWVGPRELVNTVLEQYEMGQFLENHV